MAVIKHATKLLFQSILLLHLYSSFCFDFGKPTCNCSLEPTVETVNKFNKTIDETVTFIYLKLNFINITFNTREFAYLSDTYNVIDPLTWVLAIGGKGELLLQSPFDFRYVSLGTLSISGVKTRTLNVIGTECFTYSSDEDKICAIVKLIESLAKNAVNYFNDKKRELILRLNDFGICLEKESDEKKYVYRDKYTMETLLWRLTECAHTFLQSTVEYTCYPVANDLSQPEMIPRTRAHWQVNWLLNTVVTLIVLFIPYPFFSYFDWHNPPKDDKIRIDTSPYPFGFFHFVFYSTFVRSGCTYNLCSLSCWLRCIFLAILLTLLCCVQFIPYVYVDHDNYQLRKQAAERLEVWQFDWSNRILPSYCIVCIIVNIGLFNILKFSVSRRRSHATDKDDDDWNRIGKSYLTTKLLFNQADRIDNRIIAILCPKQKGDVFVHSPSFQDIWSICAVLENLKKGKRNRCRKIILFPVILAYWIGQAIPLIYYTNIVLVVILSLVHRRFCKSKTRRVDNINNRPNADDEHDQNDNHKKNMVFLCSIIPVFWFSFVFITVPVFFQMYIACSYLIEIVGYTLVGMVVNAAQIVSWMVFIVGIVSFVVQTVTAYSDAYLRLFYDIFDIAESIGSKAVSWDTDGVVQIRENFFFDIAYRIKPWKPVLLMTYLQLTSALVFFLFGFWLLQYVDGLNDLKGQSDLIGAVIIGGFLPIANQIAISEATSKCKEKARKDKLEQLLKKYEAEQNESQKQILDKTSRPPDEQDSELHSTENLQASMV